MLSGSNLPKPSVLVIDDNAVSRQFTVEALRLCGATVKQACSSRQAVSLALSDLPAFIYTDMHLPDDDGISTREKIIRQWPGRQPRPVFIALTADDTPQMSQQVRKAGFRSVLLKPARLQDLSHSLWSDSPPLAQGVEEAGPPPFLHQMFCRELREWLPQLDRNLLSINCNPERSTKLLHQLIASSAICGAWRLEQSTRKLHELVDKAASSSEIAHAWYSFVLDSRRCLNDGEATDDSGLPHHVPHLPHSRLQTHKNRARNN